MSSQPCGCDPEAYHVCAVHRSHRIVRVVPMARGETLEIQWTDPKTGQVLVERYTAPPQATWDARREAAQTSTPSE